MSIREQRYYAQRALDHFLMLRKYQCFYTLYIVLYVSLNMKSMFIHFTTDLNLVRVCEACMLLQNCLPSALIMLDRPVMNWID